MQCPKSITLDVEQLYHIPEFREFSNEKITLDRTSAFGGSKYVITSPLYIAGNGKFYTEKETEVSFTLEEILNL